MNTNEAKSFKKLFETIYEDACKETEKLQENEQIETNDSSLGGDTFTFWVLSYTVFLIF